ncbi:DUF6115 domain-containing protein [Virgibacillus doumboii]|uniref:DUF6115 domain-containing protein n=1 Tax=Virgibacillus doumboii TaxID=2697503 RepID=UPI0013E0AE65|nr:hypothetical protein [Virgibacillus doumboii]
MNSMLLIISFLLHIVALTAIYQLFKQVQSYKKGNAQDIIELLDTYLEEIKEENRLLEEKIDKQNPQAPKVAPVNNHIRQDIEEEHEYTPPQASEDADDFEASLQAQIMHLHDKGLTVDEIARKLNCGKTEAELIIKMGNKNNNKT